MKKMLCIVVLGCLVACSPKPKERRITGTEGVVYSIENGNTICLQNGLKVTLLGVSPSEIGKKYMEANLKGKSVRLVADSRDPKQGYKSASTTVRAYVKVPGSARSVNGTLLEGAMTNGLDMQCLYDSAEVFRRYLEAPVHPLLSKVELLAKIKPATFYIQTEEGSGTGFFINDNGLALTNNHVLNNSNSSDAVVAFFGENGTLDMTNIRPINRILFTYSDDDKIDFTIFEVTINGGEKMPYIPICSKPIREGEDVAKLGCPASTVGNFQTGILSNYNDGYLTHSIAINNGDSGGPVVNFRGEAVGINQSMQINESLSYATNSIQKAEGIAYAVDIQLIKQLLDENHIKYGK